MNVRKCSAVITTFIGISGHDSVTNANNVHGMKFHIPMIGATMLRLPVSHSPVSVPTAAMAERIT
jgi:hypothetical protein